MMDYDEKLLKMNTLLNYKEILLKFNNSEKPLHLFLANGFNHSLGVNTSYKAIFERMKKNNILYEELQIGEDYDLEHIIGVLKDQIRDSSQFKFFLEKLINDKVKVDFMKSAFEIAKEGIKDIYQDKNFGVGVLFENFTNFFSINFDPFLYLLLMKYKDSNKDSALIIQQTLDFKIDDANN